MWPVLSDNDYGGDDINHHEHNRARDHDYGCVHIDDDFFDNINDHLGAHDDDGPGHYHDGDDGSRIHHNHEYTRDDHKHYYREYDLYLCTAAVDYGAAYGYHD